MSAARFRTDRCAPPGSQARHRTRRAAAAAAPRAGKEPDSRREEAGEVGPSLNALSVLMITFFRCKKLLRYVSGIAERF